MNIIEEKFPGILIHKMLKGREEMKKQQRFLISYLCNNQPNTMEISCDKDSLGVEEAEKYIRSINSARTAIITDIRVVGMHHTNNPKVHPGHYHQPEG